MSEELTRWTIRLALTAYFGALVLRIRAKRAGWGNSPARADSPGLDPTRSEKWQRGLWTVGCLLLWAHVVCAFAVYHHWSHDDAFFRTARETAERVGLDWGGGIYFNYLFLMLWTFDVAWWWTWPASYRRRSRVYSVFVDVYLAFIAFNATVVFGHGTARYLGIAATVGIVWLAWWKTIRPGDRSSGLTSSQGVE
jgi:hypothetical protein